jgi:hypothetical protein
MTSLYPAFRAKPVQTARKTFPSESFGNAQATTLFVVTRFHIGM